MRIFEKLANLFRNHSANHGAMSENEKTVEFLQSLLRNKKVNISSTTAALRGRPFPLTDECIRRLLNTYENDQNRNGLDFHNIETAIAIDEIGLRTRDEWDNRSNNIDRGKGYKKAKVRIAKILFEDNKISREDAEGLGIFT